MSQIFWESLSGGRCISVEETSDSGYARDCFEGTDREWKDILLTAEESTFMVNGVYTPAMFYIVSSGLSGCYMRDNVSVYGCKADALQAAKDEVNMDEELEAEESDEESEGVRNCRALHCRCGQRRRIPKQ